MKRSTLWIVIAVLLIVTAPASAQSLEEILDGHFAAIGGKDKIAKVQSIKMTGKQQAGPQEVALSILWKRPDKVRIEFSIQGMTGVQAYDGKTGWMVMPFLGKTEPEAMTGDDLRSATEQADLLEGPLYNWKEKGHQVELIGKESIEGTDAWKLKVTRKGGEVTHYYLEAESLLQIKADGKRKRGDQEIEFESSIGDYKEVGGILFPHSIEQKPKGAPAGAMITIDAIEIDPEIPDALFAMPEKKAEPAAPPADKE